MDINAVPTGLWNLKKTNQNAFRIHGEIFSTTMPEPCSDMIHSKVNAELGRLPFLGHLVTDGLKDSILTSPTQLSPSCDQKLQRTSQYCTAV